MGLESHVCLNHVFLILGHQSLNHIIVVKEFLFSGICIVKQCQQSVLKGRQPTGLVMQDCFVICCMFCMVQDPFEITGMLVQDIS